MAYLPDVNFDHTSINPRNRSVRRTNQGVNANWLQLGYFNTDNLEYNPDNLGPIQILRDAFEKYIIQTPIQSNTIGIQIIYLENENSVTPKMVFLVKRTYNGVTEEYRVNRNATSRLSYARLNNRNVFQNDQLTQVIEQLQGFHRILQITLCEIYNDDNVSRRRAERARGRWNTGYYPYTIPIQILYRDIPNTMITSQQEERRTSREERRTSREDRRLQQEEEQELREARRRVEQNERLLQSVEDESERLQAEQAARRAGVIDEDEMNRAFAEMNQWDVEAPPGLTAPPLPIVDDQEIINKPINRYVWPGLCTLCYTDDPVDLCRVNCTVGHIFHCDCIRGWRNTYRARSWNIDCPTCHEEISRMAQVTPEVASTLPTAFGKSSKRSMERRSGGVAKQLKNVEAEIRYLLK